MPEWHTTRTQTHTWVVSTWHISRDEMVLYINKNNIYRFFIPSFIVYTASHRINLQFRMWLYQNEILSGCADPFAFVVGSLFCSVSNCRCHSGVFFSTFRSICSIVCVAIRALLRNFERERWTWTCTFHEMCYDTVELYTHRTWRTRICLKCKTYNAISDQRPANV